MPRRSERLVTVGYYNQSSDEESSSSISYRESPVRVFNKKRTGGRKGGSSRSSQASGTVSATNVTNERNINADDIGLAPTLRATQRRQTFLSPSSVAPSVALEPSLSFSSMSYSSGYCSEEPPRLRTRSSRSFSSGISTRTGASCTRSWLPSWLPSWFAILLFLLPFLLTFVFLFSTAFPTMKMNLMTRPTQPDPRPDLTQKTMHGTPTMNSAFEMKMDSILREIEMMKQKEKQQRDISEMVQIMTKDLRDVRAEIDDMRVSVDSVGFESVSFDRRLDQEATEFSKQLADHQEHQFLTRGRVRALEDVSNTLQHQVTSIKNQPPPAPTPTNTHLTPEFKEAMGKWLRDRLAQDVKQVVKDYSRPLADKMPNFALESQGGSIVTSRCSETYKTGSAHVSFLGIPLWFPSESPRTVIQGQRVQPGKCWRFHGAQGTMTVALSHPVHVTHVTVEHISAAISATGHIKSAPKDFAVYGMATDREEGTRLGTFMFNQAGDPVQTFKLPNLNSVYHYVELRILSNWGHQEYTCVYRIRVHGKMPSV
ncbi:SUN domain-containing protein 1 isoform X2 [Coregonus clupeaformis]|uniref:SUN domain-containing protein 1 isoform X2 n=1 Tax=Coregonus clupeaformis TaxID=59861 RepID=UPI001E1C5475|nr:SUN domain-containing protein 1 isoform X2 [Coregonus clupeaformis]